jgi:hypothetical protein
MTVWRVHTAVEILPNEQKTAVKFQKKARIKESTGELGYNIMAENILCCYKRVLLNKQMV